MALLDQLKKRRVFRVAAIYVIVAWGILQVVDVVADPLHLPAWFATTVVVLLAIGFPLALVLGWAFNVDDGVVTRSSSGDVVMRPAGGHLETVLLLVVVLGLGWLILRDVTGTNNPAALPEGTPVVVLMDTFAATGVYDEETLRKGGTNADVLSDVLQSLPVITQKEATGSAWDRETQIIRQNPSLVLIHRSSFFHSMYQDLGFAAQETTGALTRDQAERLYDIADNKLIAFLGTVGNSVSHTRFLIYSRGTGDGWTQEEFRESWVETMEGRFPSLKGRVATLAVPGGVAEGSFLDPETQALMRRLVSDTLELPGG